MTNSLVFDLGAGSGRAMLAHFDGQKLELSEIHRFSGIEVRLAEGPHWDLDRLLSEIRTGLRLAAARYRHLDSIGVDSWGVDYALIDGDGKLESAPFHYRHPRSQQGYDRFPIPPQTMFSRTGSQVLPINTAYQLFSALQENPEKIALDQRLVMIADAVNYFLTGEIAGEATLARSTGLLALSGEWDETSCREAGIPLTLLPPIMQPGGICGWLRQEFLTRFESQRIPVIAVAGHDTASAVCGLPLAPNEAFLVCGSWSILGRELSRPLVSEEARSSGFGNEGGVGGRPIFLRSLNGLHLLQKLKTVWARQTGEDVGFDEMSARAAAAVRTGRNAAIDPSDPIFFDPPDMIGAIKASCHDFRSNQPDELGPLALAVYRGLAKDIGANLAVVERLGRERITRLRICGGGGRDAFLCQLIADSTKRPLAVGPIEASAWGNAALQLIGLGLVENLSAARTIVEKSADIVTYYPNKNYQA